MKNYSQAGQDLFVLSLFPEGYRGFFLDLGCQHPTVINNTCLLEQNGWTGVSFDIVDYSKEWEERTTPFYCEDAMRADFNQYGLPEAIDYLSLDISEYEGMRFACLKRLLLNFPFRFAVITLEHDSYQGYESTERDPQRLFLLERDYLPLRVNISNGGNPFEDWWIKREFFDIETHARV